MSQEQDVALESNKTLSSHTNGRMVQLKNGQYKPLHWRYKAAVGYTLFLTAAQREVAGTRKRPFVVKLGVAIFGMPPQTVAMIVAPHLKHVGLKLGSWTFDNVGDVEIRFHQIMLAVLTHIKMAPAPQGHMDIDG